MVTNSEKIVLVKNNIKMDALSSGKFVNCKSLIPLPLWATFYVSFVVGGSQAFKSNRAVKNAATQDLSQRMDALSEKSTTSLTAIEQCSLWKQELLDKLEVVAPYLPPNTLDELIDELGGPEHVSEVWHEMLEIILEHGIWLVSCRRLKLRGDFGENSHRGTRWHSKFWRPFPQ